MYFIFYHKDYNFSGLVAVFQFTIEQLRPIRLFGLNLEASNSLNFLFFSFTAAKALGLPNRCLQSTDSGWSLHKGLPLVNAFYVTHSVKRIGVRCCPMHYCAKDSLMWKMSTTQNVRFFLPYKIYIICFLCDPLCENESDVAQCIIV